MTAGPLLRTVAIAGLGFLAGIFVLSLPIAGADSLDVRDWGFLAICVVVGALAAGAALVLARPASPALVPVAAALPAFVTWAIVATNGDNDLVRVLAAVLVPLAALAGARAGLGRARPR